MIFAEWLSPSLNTCHSARVPGISTVNFLRSDQDNVGGAPSTWFLLILGSIVLFPHLFLNIYNLFFACLSQEQLVHLEEGFFKCLFVLFVLVVSIIFELLDKMPLDKGSYFGTYLDISVPPCPSNTQNSEFLPSRSGAAEMWASSI